MQDQLARWDRVWEAGIALSRHITTLTTEHEQSTASGTIFRTVYTSLFPTYSGQDRGHFL